MNGPIPAVKRPGGIRVGMPISIPVSPNLQALGSLSREHANRVRNNSRFLVDRRMGAVRSHGGGLDP